MSHGIPRPARDSAQERCDARVLCLHLDAGRGGCRCFCHSRPIANPTDTDGLGNPVRPVWGRGHSHLVLGLAELEHRDRFLLSPKFLSVLREDEYRFIDLSLPHFGILSTFRSTFLLIHRINKTAFSILSPVSATLISDGSCRTEEEEGTPPPRQSLFSSLKFDYFLRCHKASRFQSVEVGPGRDTFTRIALSVPGNCVMS